MLTLRQVKKAEVYNEIQSIPLFTNDTGSPNQYTTTTQGPGVGNLSGDFKPFEDNERDDESIESWIKMYPRLKELMRVIKRPFMGGAR